MTTLENPDLGNSQRAGIRNAMIGISPSLKPATYAATMENRIAMRNCKADSIMPTPYTYPW
ncbi:Uncharacterised protein [Vibrio cholerae]|nr:Uncharacterised protein [Vibrio cholerae]CSI72127.1 Uncharacterised protein [Vibrio cholerae]